MNNGFEQVSTLFAILLGVLLAACGGEQDVCEKAFAKQVSLISEASDVSNDMRKEAVAPLRKAKPRIISLCREALENDGEVAQKALDCTLGARSLADARKCEVPPTVAAGLAALKLGTRASKRTPPPEHGEPPQVAPSEAAETPAKANSGPRPKGADPAGAARPDLSDDPELGH